MYKVMYKVEDGIDFYSAICQPDVEEENICLITNERLEDDFIKLSCGHSFNYKNLYYDVFNQKINIKFANETMRLKINEYKCPYCRKIQKIPLPEKDGFLKVYPINTTDSNYSIGERCHSSIESLKKYKEGECDVIDCSNKYILSKYGHSYCYRHAKLSFQEIIIINNQITMVQNKNIMFKEQMAKKKEEKDAEKKAKAEAKAIEKDEAKKAKAEAKAIEKEEAKKAKAIEKEEAKKAKVEATAAAKALAKLVAKTELAAKKAEEKEIKRLAKLETKTPKKSSKKISVKIELPSSD